MKELTQEQKERIAAFVPAFQQYRPSLDEEADWEHRRKRRELYSQTLSPSGIDQMTELEFGQYISSLWASRMWGNKSYLVKKLIRKNGLPSLKQNLKRLLWGQGSIAERYDVFRQSVEGIGTASITETLAFVFPTECGLWNDKARKALMLLGFQDTFPLIRKNQISGREYEGFNVLLRSIRDELENCGIHGFDLLGVDYFLYAVCQTGQGM